MKTLAVVVIVMAALAMAPSAQAQTCYSPITTWQGTYSLNGSGTAACFMGTCSINQAGSADVSALYVGGGCTGAGWAGPDTNPTVSLNDVYTSPCLPTGNGTETFTGTGGGFSSSFLLIDLSTFTYKYYSSPWENYTRVDVACDGTTTTGSGKTALYPLTNWPQILSLPTQVGPLTANNLSFQGTAGSLYAIVPWTFSFTLTPTYITDDDCKQSGNSSIGCQNQSLGEDVPVVGTGFNLHYEGGRAPGAGGNSVASADASMIGGWTLSVHHAYDPASNTLFLGDGEQRNGWQLGTPVSLNGNSLLTSEDGSEVYVFNSTRQHLQTLRPLTGAVEYQFGYDAAGKLVTVTDGSGNVTTITRDASEHATTIVSPHGLTTTLSMDSAGFLSQVIDPLLKSATFTNGSTGLLTSRTDENGNIFNYTYDGQGKLTKDSDSIGGYTALAATHATSGLGSTVTQTTAMGRTSSSQSTLNVPWMQDGTLPFSEQRTNTWPNGLQATNANSLQSGQLGKSVALPDGTADSKTQGSDPVWGLQVPITTSETLARGNLTMSISHSRSTTLGTVGNPFSVAIRTDTKTINGRTYTSTFTGSNLTYVNASPVGRTLTVGLDSLERVASTQIEGLLAKDFTYDSLGRVASATQGTRKSTFSYNPQGFLAVVTDPLKRKSSFTYDANGHLAATTLPDGRVLSYVYDANGNLTALTPPGKSAHNFAYNAVNLLASYTPPTVLGSGATTYAYDLDRNLTTVTRPDSRTINYNYDNAGRLASVGTPTGTTTYTYSSTTGNLASAANGSEHLTYGYNGPLPTKSTWTGTVAGNVARTYNNNFWVASQSINGGNAVAFNHDNDGLLTKAGSLTIRRSPKNGLITATTLSLATDSRTYNTFGELTGYNALANGASVYSEKFTRDADGRVTANTETIGGTTNTYAYTYDSAGRLTAASKNAAIDSYTYDTNSNRLSATTSSGTSNGAYDAQDRLLTYGNTTFTYTANGELASQIVGTQTTTYNYDVLQNLIAVTLPTGAKITYLVDAENHRVGKQVNGVLQTGFLYDGDRIVAQLNGSNQLVTQFVYASRATSPDYMVSGGVTYRVFSDQLGSPVVVVNTSTGAIAEQMTYDEFGNVISDTSPGFQPFGFAGGLYDQDTKLVRFGLRDYNPSIGRWTAKDPIRFGAGDTNLYGYASTDPVNSSDPTGLCPEWIKKIGHYIAGDHVKVGAVEVSTDKPEISVGASGGVQVNGVDVATAAGKVAVGITTDGGVTDDMFYIDATVKVKAGPVTVVDAHAHAEGGNPSKGPTAQQLNRGVNAADACNPECH